MMGVDDVMVINDVMVVDDYGFRDTTSAFFALFDFWHYSCLQFSFLQGGFGGYDICAIVLCMYVCI